MQSSKQIIISPRNDQIIIPSNLQILQINSIKDIKLIHSENEDAIQKKTPVNQHQNILDSTLKIKQVQMQETAIKKTNQTKYDKCSQPHSNKHSDLIKMQLENKHIQDEINEQRQILDNLCSKKEEDINSNGKIDGEKAEIQKVIDSIIQLNDIECKWHDMAQQSLSHLRTVVKQQGIGNDGIGFTMPQILQILGIHSKDVGYDSEDDSFN